MAKNNKHIAVEIEDYIVLGLPPAAFVCVDKSAAMTTTGIVREFGKISAAHAFAEVLRVMTDGATGIKVIETRALN